MKIFLAAPFFSEAEREYNSDTAGQIRKQGHEVWVPQEAPFINEGTPAEKKRIFEEDIRALESCDAIVAILDGLDVESGVAFELGYAHCLHKPILGLKTDYRTFSRIEEINLMVEESSLRICKTIQELLVALQQLAARK